MADRIRVIDIETCGLDPASGVVEIGWCDLVAEDGRQWRVDGSSRGSLMVNPGVPIPPEASAVHHLVDDDVSLGLSLAEAARLALNPTEPLVAFAAHNAKFERSFLPPDTASRLPWICTYKGALRLWPEAPAHTNQALRYWRKPADLDRRMAEMAHRAEPDAYVTAFLLRDMLGAATVDDLIRWSSEPALQIRCQIGKNRGKLWSEIDDGFLRWLLDKDFDEDVLFTARHELDRRQKEAAAPQNILLAAG